jgi:hypothetical protein
VVAGGWRARRTNPDSRSSAFDADKERRSLGLVSSNHLHAQGENRKIDLVGQPGPFREFCTLSTFGNHYGVREDLSRCAKQMSATGVFRPIEDETC